MKRGIRLVAINFVVFLGLLLLLNLCCFLFLRLTNTESSGPHMKGKEERYASIKNDKSVAYNKLMMSEYKAIKYEYVPYVGWSKKAFQGKTATVNALGDRVHQPPRPLSDSAAVVRFFGGSTMWGSGADDQGTIPAFFNTLFPEKRIFNHGESGFNTRQHLARLINLINQEEPLGLVIFYDGHNDINDLCLSDVGPNEHVRMAQLNDLLKRDRQLKSKVFIFKETFKTATYGYIAMLINQLKQPTAAPKHWPCKCCTDESELEKTANQIIANWQIAKKLVEGYKGQFLVFLQPSAYISHTPLFDKLDLGKRDPCMLHQHEKIYKIIRAKLEGVDWFYDISHLLDDHGEYYIDMVHVSAPANQLIAQSMAEAVRHLAKNSSSEK